MMYRNEDYLIAIDLVNQGKVQLKPLISKHFAFRDYLKAYKYIDENRGDHHEGHHKRAGMTVGKWFCPLPAKIDRKKVKKTE